MPGDKSQRPDVGPLSGDQTGGVSFEDDLPHADANLAALLENTGDYILFSDREGRPLFYNSAYAEVMKSLLGIDMRPGLKPHELLPSPEARAEWDEYHRRVLSGERFRIEYSYPIGDDEFRYFEVSYSPVRKDGEIIGFSEFTRDITDRKERDRILERGRERLEREVAARTRELKQINESLVAEIAERRRAVDELRASEARFRALTEYSTDITVILGDTGRFTYVSPSVRHYGYVEGDVLGRDLAMFVHPDDLGIVGEAIRNAIEEPGTAVRPGMFRVRRASGEFVEIEGVVISLLGVEGVNGVVFNGRDVSERLRLEARLRQSEKMDAIGKLAGGVAHDFNNQLTGILASADLLTRKLTEPKHHALAEQIKQAGRRSADLTGKLLAFARKGQYQMVSIDLNRTVAEVVELLKRSLDKRIAFELCLAESPLYIVGDPSLLQNALLNLALNARDAMPNGGALEFALSSTSLDADALVPIPFELAAGEYARVVVRDDGVGMDEATQQRIFEPFFTTKEPGKGTGMGLASVYGTIRSHRGAIRVTSALGRGTTIEILIPAASGCTVTSLETRRMALARPLRVMVVDDDEPVRCALISCLETLGHKVIACGGGREAIARFERAPDAIDLVILDMIMPDMDGAETFASLREIAPDVRVLLVSGNAVEGAAQTLTDSGARGLLHKPFNLDALATAVSTACAKSEDHR